MDGEAFSLWFKARLKRRNMRQADFVRASGLPRSTVSEWYRGTRTPDPESCDKIAEVLDVDRDSVLSAAGHRPDEPDLDPDDIRAIIIERVRRANICDQTNNIILLGIMQTLDRLTP